MHSGRKASRTVVIDKNLKTCGPMCDSVLLLDTWKGRADDASLLDIMPLIRCV